MGKDGILVTVYGLASSEDGRIRYVGQTTGRLDRRLIHHRHDAMKLGRIHKSNWFRSVIERGHKVIIFPIEEKVPWGLAEIRLIAWYRKHGVDLVNTTTGGEGVVGYVRDEKWRAMMSAKMKGRVGPNKGKTLSPETRAKISAAQQPRKDAAAARRALLPPKVPKPKGPGPEGKARLSAQRKGVSTGPRSAETRAKISAAHMGRKMSPESIAKSVASRVGWKPSDETRALWSKIRTGKTLTAEQRAKQSASLERAYAEGRKSRNNKIQESQVAEIKQLLRGGAATRDLAKQFGISEPSICDIKYRRTWRHVS